MCNEAVWNVDVALFDLDGTIVDLNFPDPTLMDAREEVTQLYADHGIDDHFSPFLGTIQEATAALRNRGDYELAAELRARAYERLEEEDVKAARTGAVRIDARPLLVEIRDAGVPFGVVTNNSRAGAREILDGSGLPAPDVLVAREDVERPKPDPEMILLALDEVGGRPDSYLMIGDSPSDVTAARRADREIDAKSTTVLLGDGDADSNSDTRCRRLRHLQDSLYRS